MTDVRIRRDPVKKASCEPGGGGSTGSVPDVAAGSGAVDLIPKREPENVAPAGIMPDGITRVEENRRMDQNPALLKFALDNVHEAAYIVDIDARFHFVNKNACQSLGYSQDELLSMGIPDIDPEFSLDVLRQQLPELNTIQSLVFESRHRKKDGSFIPVEVYCNYFEFGGQGYIMSLVRDITERKRADALLRDSEEKYRMAVEESLAGVYIIQGNRFKFVNRRFCEESGFAAEELVDVMDPMDFIHPDDRDLVRNNIRKRLTGEVEKLKYEFRGFRKDGRIIALSVMERRVLFRGKPAVHGTAIDVTREKELESQLLQLQKLQAIGTLAGGIAHDFNNILGALMGHTELALLASEESKKKYHLELVMKSCKRAQNLTSQILSIGRRKEEERRPVDVRIVVKEVTKLLRSTIPAIIDIRKAISVEPIVVLADPAWIHQILMNLCTNAHHAMESDAGILTVSLDGIDVTDGMLPGLNLSPGPYARLRVSDTGRGIHASIRERIFEPYFSTKEIGKGNGLGLSIVHGIVRNIGGAVDLESEQGKGSVFNVYLPRNIESKDRHDEIGVTTKILSGAGERLLLVDDEISIVEIQKEILSFHGYEVVGVADSQTALEIFETSPDRFDAVITDYTMPRMTGLDMARRMMAIKPEIPVLMCSGFNERIKEENLQASGIRKFFLKPVTMSVLLHGLRTVLDEIDPR